MLYFATLKNVEAKAHTEMLYTIMSNTIRTALYTIELWPYVAIHTTIN